MSSVFLSILKLFKVEYFSFIMYWGSEPLRGHSLVLCEKSVSNPKSGKFSMLCPQALKWKRIQSIKTNSEFSPSKQGVQMRTVGNAIVTKAVFPSDLTGSTSRSPSTWPLPFDHSKSLDVALGAAGLCLLFATPSDYWMAIIVSITLPCLVADMTDIDPETFLHQ